MSKTMAEVLMAHWSASTHTERTPFVDKCDGCGAVVFSWGDPTVADGSGHLAAHQSAALTDAGFGPVADAKAEALGYLVANSPRLPRDVRNVVFEAVLDVVDRFKFPAQNCGTSPDIVEIGDVCGEVEKRIVAILRARAVAERGEG